MQSKLSNRKRLLVAVAVGAFALSGGSGIIGVGEALADSSGSATVHFSNASARSAACKANNLQAIFITVSDIRGHAGRSGWVDFTPDLHSSPVQVNLMDTGAESGEPQFENTDDCLLTSTGTNSGIPAGKYQQFRVVVDTSGAAPSSNACEAALGAGVFNCVELTDNTFHALTVPSGSQTGIKIPSTKIAKGGVTIANGQAVDLDIDIDGCRSIVVTGGGRGHRRKPPHSGASYKLKPVLQAGEVTLNSLISGQVVLGTNNSGTVTPNSPAVPIQGAAVWLEETTSTTTYTEGNPTPTGTTVPVNGVVAMTRTDSNGNFAFCPVPNDMSGLELVAIAGTMPAAAGPNPSDVTITKDVQTGAKGGMSGLVIPLVEPSSAPTPTAQYTTQTSTPSAISESVALGMTQSDGTNQAPFAFANDTSSINPTTTGPSVAGCTCPTNTDCSCVILDVPPDEPVLGSASGGSYQQSSATGEFSLLAQTHGSGPGSCSPNLMATAPNQSSVALPAPTLSFQMCQ